MNDEKTAGAPVRVARQPEQCNRLLLAALEAGDIETSVQLYETAAVLFTKSGRTVTGHDAIRENNAALIALHPRFQIDDIILTLSGDGTIATTRMKARLSVTRADGKPVEGVIHTLEVLRKQPDGSWRYVIDDPYGSMRADMETR